MVQKQYEIKYWVFFNLPKNKYSYLEIIYKHSDNHKTSNLIVNQLLIVRYSLFAYCDITLMAIKRTRRFTY